MRRPVGVAELLRGVVDAALVPYRSWCVYLNGLESGKRTRRGNRGQWVAKQWIHLGRTCHYFGHDISRYLGERGAHPLVHPHHHRFFTQATRRQQFGALLSQIVVVHFRQTEVVGERVEA